MKNIIIGGMGGGALKGHRGDTQSFIATAGYYHSVIRCPNYTMRFYI
jgi:hypothetical protein